MVVFVRAVLHGHAPINATPLSGRSLPWRILILKGQSQRPKHHPKRFRFEPQQKSIAVYKPPKTTRSIYMVFEFQFIGHMVLEFPRLRPNPMIPWHLQRQSLPRSQKVKFSILLYQGMSNTGPSANICSWYKNSPLVHFCSHLYQTRSIRHRSALRQLQRNFKVLAFQAAPMSSAESVLHFFQSLKGTWFPYSMILWSIGVLILFRSIDLEESNQQQGGMDPKTVGQSQSIPTPVIAHLKQT